MDFSCNLQFNTKGYMVNEALPEDHGARVLQFLFRPTQAETDIAPQYNEQAVLGMSHANEVYSYTRSQEISFDLYWNALMGMKEKGRFEAGSEKSTGKEGGASQLKHFGQRIAMARRWLESLAYPPEAVPGALGGSAPTTALLILPGIVAIRGRISSLHFTFLDCDVKGNIKELVAAISVKESLRTRITMEDVLDLGSFRS